MTIRKPAYPPQSERHHFVFLKACGCPIGLTEARRGVTDEGEAWDDFYDTRAEERAARARGVHVVHVDHATYSRDFFPLMTSNCPHH